MNRFEYSVTLLGITAAALIANTVNLKAFADEVPMELINQQTSAQVKTESELGNISYSAADLLPASDSSDNSLIAQRLVDPIKFCKDYPFNSACTDKKLEEKTEGEVEATEPVEEETKKAKTSGWAVTPEIGTLGIGASVTKSVSPNINARVGLNAFSLDINDIEAEDTTADANVNLFNVSTLVDYHPSKKSGFRLTAGLVFNNNKIDGNVKPSNNTITINGVDYEQDKLESADVEASLGSNDVAPYLGIGWGNAVKPGNRFAFSLNLGVMFNGSSKVTITPKFGPGATDADKALINQDIADAEQDFNDEIDFLKVYPVLSIGASYHF
ncbi:MAG: hypothetical protein SWZ49_18460 [Cyanobacteriota bacterium]|nr:hypothetical protein [Cyanobacteriota bacterium]